MNQPISLRILRIFLVMTCGYKRSCNVSQLIYRRYVLNSMVPLHKATVNNIYYTIPLIEYSIDDEFIFFNYFRHADTPSLESPSLFFTTI